MGQMRIKRLPDGGFELSGGPLILRHEQDLRDVCIQLLRFPGLQFQPENGEPTFVETMTMEDENAELPAEPNGT